MRALAIFKKEFDKSFLSFLEGKEKQLAKIDPRTGVLIEEMKQLVLAGGKRIRPAFTYYAYLIGGGKDKKKILPVCFAVELGQIFALIHDDIIDNSSKRRGRPTTFKKLGLAPAIMAGDLAISLADEIFTDLRLEAKACLKVKKYFDILKKETIIGEYLDVLKAQNRKEALKILFLKTASYSVIRPLHLGAAAAGADKKYFQIFERYGKPLGMAFQLADDILGTFGTAEAVGKPVDSDLKEGKRTLLVIETLKKAKGQERQKFLSLLGNKDLGREDLEWVKSLMVKTGSLSYCQRLTQEFNDRAKLVIRQSPIKGPARQFLLEVADFIVNRKF